MKKKIILPAILGILTVLSLTSCGEKPITKVEAQELYAKTIDTQRSKEYVKPKTITINAEINTSKDEKNTALNFEVKYDLDNFYLYSKSTVKENDESMILTAYAYIKDNSFYSYIDTNGTVVASKTSVDVSVSFETAINGSSFKDGIKIADVQYLEYLKSTFLSSLYLNSSTKYYSKGEGSLIIDFDSSLTIENLKANLTFKLEIENYRLSHFKNNVDLGTDEYQSTNFDIQYDKNVVSYLDENLFTK